jgi:transposase
VGITCMMGQRGGKQDRLFYTFNLNDHVPADHMLRGIDRYLDLTDLRQHLEAYYSHTGRPSVDPELMIRMLLVGYCFGIRSERRLCDEVHLNLAYRWFCRLGLEDQVPDHSSFSKNRHGRFRKSDVFRHVFEGVVQRCMTEGLVRAEGFAVDASIIKADANRRRGIPSEEGIDWGNPQLGTRAVREYLQALEEEGQIGTIPKNISLTDPGARWTAAPGCPAFFAYSTNYLVDIHAGVIVDVEATAAHRTEENDATKKMIDRVEERFDLKPQRLIRDTAYGTAAMLNWLVNEKQIEPHVPVWDHTQRTTEETFPNSDIKWDEQRNEYRCPQRIRATHRLASIQELAVTRHQRRRNYLSIKAIRMRQMPHEVAVLPIRRFVNSVAAFMKPHATLLVRSPRPAVTSNRAMIERKSKYCSRISSGS